MQYLRERRQSREIAEQAAAGEPYENPKPIPKFRLSNDTITKLRETQLTRDFAGSPAHIFRKRDFPANEPREELNLIYWYFTRWSANDVNFAFGNMRNGLADDRYIPGLFYSSISGNEVPRKPIATTTLVIGKTILIAEGQVRYLQNPENKPRLELLPGASLRPLEEGVVYKLPEYCAQSIPEVPVGESQIQYHWYAPYYRRLVT